MRSTDDKYFLMTNFSRNTDVTDANLFSDVVATQVLDDAALKPVPEIIPKSSNNSNISEGCQIFFGL